MQRKLSKLISISFLLTGIFLMPVESNDENLKSNYSKNNLSKINNISCNDERYVLHDFEGSFDHENLTMINRVNEKNNIIDFFGIGPSRYPENRIVQESKKMWDTFECHLSRFTEKYKPKTKDIFNGYSSSLSEFE